MVMKISSDNPVLIAGGGIGGLSLALALGLKGIAAILVEQTEKFSEVGAGIQLGPNATRILSGWGLSAELESCIYQPESINIKNGYNNTVLNTIPLIPLAEKLYSAPYYTIHRADLHNLLLKAVRNQKTVTLMNDFQVMEIEETDEGGIAISSEKGERIQGSILIGADGIWSRVRSHIHPKLQPSYSGKTAWRALIPIDKLTDYYKSQVSLYLGPDSHLVHYPVRGGKLLNIVAVINDPEEPGKQWDRSGDSEQLIGAFQAWSPDLRGFLSRVENWTKWALFTHKCPPKWSAGNIALLGDAVHPTLPFMAQGAVMAIEDALCLADLLANSADNPKQKLMDYQKTRYRRAVKVQTISKRQGTIYHLTGPFAFARNQVISHRSPQSLLKEYSWLYGYKS